MSHPLVAIGVASSWSILVACSGSFLAHRIDAVLEGGLVAGLRTVTPPRDRRHAARDAAAALTAPLAMGLLLGTNGCTLASAGVLAVFGGAWIAARVDAESGVVPDVVTLPLLLGGLLAAVVWGSGVGAPTATGGAIVGWAIGTLVRLAGRRLGMGDVKLLAAIGTWVGPQATAATFLLAALLMVPVFLLSRRRRAPFAPAIAAALLLVLVASRWV